MGYAGAERLTMNMGPQHPSSHGVFRAILTLEGETVVAVDAVIGYLHRCHEKLAESRPTRNTPPSRRRRTTSPP